MRTGCYRVRRGWFGKAILQTQRQLAPGCDKFWEDIPYYSAPQSLFFEEEKPNLLWPVNIGEGTYPNILRWLARRVGYHSDASEEDVLTALQYNNLLDYRHALFTILDILGKEYKRKTTEKDNVAA